MRVLRGTLTFVLGMVIGIILFVLAIGGTVLILATQVTVGKLQTSIIGSDIISSDSELYNKTVFEAVSDVMDDFHNFDKLSLKTLYDHYGISLLNGISGIDFTSKEFYDAPIASIMNDLSIVVNSFTLDDITKIAGVDLTSYNLPILTDNLDNNVSTAVDNILKSINGDVTVRAIKDNFGIDLGVNDNDMLATLQDVGFSSLGSVIDVLRLSMLLNADTDTFVPRENATLYVVPEDDDAWVEVSQSDLANKNYVAPKGVETYLAGGKDTDGDSVSDIMDMRELRYVQNIEVIDGAETYMYAVDNSCYSDSFDASTNTKKFYRRVLYAPARSGDSGTRYVESFANHIDTFNGTGYTLVSKGFIPYDEDAIRNGGIWGIEGTVDKDSKLSDEVISPSVTYAQVHTGKAIAVLQKFVYMTIGEIRNVDSLFDSLTIADIVEINESSPKIIKSLVARNCKIKDLANVAGELPLGEIIAVNSNEYEVSPSGKYVRYEDEDIFVLYDGSTATDLQRYKRNSDGSFIEDANGKFVHSVYYAPYNAALHTDRTRYNKVETLGASSMVLQRFADATLDGFSDVLSNLMLSDVLEIDMDIFAIASEEYISEHPNERFFRYDSDKGVYLVTSEDYRSEHNETYYHVVSSGTSTSFLKKLAFVKVDKMADAMETVIDDMMVSEILDIYTASAVTLGTSGRYIENSDYFIEYSPNAPYCGANEHGKFVYVYDENGEYVKSNVIYTPLDGEVLDNSNEIYYIYKSFAELMEKTDSLTAYTRYAELVACGNLYYFDSADNEYKSNFVLCNYMLNHKDANGNNYYDKVFFRQAVDATETSDTIFMGSIATIKDGAQSPEYGLFVKDDFLGYIAYDSTNPAFADRYIGTFIKSSKNAENALEYFILKDEVSFYTTALREEALLINTDITYSTRQCENVYISDTNGDYVYIDGQYVGYDSDEHDSNITRFVRRIGYLASSEEAFREDTFSGVSTHLSEFGALEVISYEQKKSSPVLRLLARGTLGEMTDIIANATIGDVVEVEPGSLFDIEEIKNSKISEVSKAFARTLTDMTIGDLISWSNVTDVDARVKKVLDNVTINNLMHSFRYSSDTVIYIDVLALYGYNG